MSLFFTSSTNVKDGRVFLEEEESHHLLHVLRKKAGDLIHLSFGQGQSFEAKISEIHPDVVLEIISEKKNSEGESSSLLIAPALLKGPRMDWLMEKATELGVSQIIPLLTERGIVKAKTSAEKLNKIRRWQRISQAALKQSERSLLPQIGPILSFSEMMERFEKSKSLKILFTIPTRETPPLKKLEEVLRTHHNGDFSIVVTGPEGGFTMKEIKRAEKAGFQFSSLGSHTLRAETAALTAISVLNYLQTSTQP